MEITREVELDASADEVWELLSDPDELAAWVGDEVREARLAPPDPGSGRRLAWTWAPDGVESEVEIALEEVGDRTVVRVVERRATATASARACTWDDRLFDLEVRCLTRTRCLARI